MSVVRFGLCRHGWRMLPKWDDSDMSSAVTRMTVAAALLTASLVPVLAQAPRPPDTSTRALVAAARKYVGDYEKNFAFLVADEWYQQVQRDSDGRIRLQRVLKSELFLTFIEADGEWIAVRDVMEVDGRPTPNRDRLRDLLAKGGQFRGVAKQVIESNARYNIGSVARNFNEPTLPLLLFETRRESSVTFDRKHVARAGTTTLATLAFSERDRDTLVAGEGGPAPAKGVFVIDAATGTVRETTFEIKHANIRATLKTQYDHDAKLNLWLPATFSERYERTKDVKDLIECEARYSNYRRFEATGRIKGGGWHNDGNDGNDDNIRQPPATPATKRRAVR